MEPRRIDLRLVRVLENWWAKANSIWKSTLKVLTTGKKSKRLIYENKKINVIRPSKKSAHSNHKLTKTRRHYSVKPRKRPKNRWANKMLWLSKTEKNYTKTREKWTWRKSRTTWTRTWCSSHVYRQLSVEQSNKWKVPSWKSTTLLWCKHSRNLIN